MPAMLLCLALGLARISPIFIAKSGFFFFKKSKKTLLTMSRLNLARLGMCMREETRKNRNTKILLHAAFVGDGTVIS
jgi:hypothetical protein